MNTLERIITLVRKDIDTLFTTIKTMGIFLYAPVLIYVIPEIPQWIRRIFPTYPSSSRWSTSFKMERVGVMLQ